MVGHSGKHGCNLYCDIPGHCKERDGHYYPVMLKPEAYNVAGCNHNNIIFSDLMQHQNETSAHYQNNLYRLLRANNLTQYKDCHFKTRLCKQTIFSGLCISLGIPGIFPLDIMHLVNLNNPDLLLKLWHETIKMYPSDNIEHWDWCVLVGNVWQAHGKSVVMATLYIPSIISALVLPYSNTFLQRNIGSTTASISQMFASCSNGQSLQMIYNRDIGYSVELHKNSSSCIANGILIGSILSNIASIS